MIRIVALALIAIALSARVAPAQIVIVQSPPRVLTYAPPPIYVPAPVVTYSSPVVYSVPVATYSSPAVSYSYYPATTVYSAPPPVSYSYYPATTVYSAPAVVVPGVVTTRSYIGLGIFRPRGVYTETYISPR